MGWGLARIWIAAAALAAGIAHAQPVLDLSGWNPQDGARTLDGKWDFAPGRLIAPGDVWPADSTVVDVPHEWSGGACPRRGVGTYRVTVRCDSTQPLALALTFQHSAARVFVNGRLVAEQGQPGLTRDDAQPSVKQQIQPLPPSPCPMQVLVQVSNWDMYRGGFVRSVVVGTPQDLAQRHEDIVLRVQTAQGALLFAALFGFGFWLRRRRERGALLFSVFAVSIAMTLSLGGERAHGSLAEYVSFDAFMRIIYLNWFFSLGTFPWVLQELYRGEGSHRFVWAVTGISAAGGLLAIATPAHILTWTTPLLGVGSIIVGAYVVGLLLRAVVRRRSGAALLLGALAIFSVAVFNDILVFQRISSTALMPYGILAIVLAPAVLMAQRFAQALTAEELRTLEQRERADLLLRSTRAGVLDWDGVTHQQAFSGRLRELLGLPDGPDAPPPPPFESLIHPEDRARVDASFRSQLRDRSVKGGVRGGDPIEYRMRRSDGEWIWMMAESIFLCDAQGRTLRFITSLIDITERKQHEAEMVNRLKFINDLFDSVPIGLALRDADGKYLFVNREWERNNGLTREQVLGMSLQGVEMPEAKAALALDREALARAPGESDAPREVDAFGRRFMQTRTVMADAQGNRIGVLVASVDITDKHATEQALATERERLALLVRSTKAGFGDWDAVRDTVTYSGRFKEMLGWEPDADTSGWPSIFEMMHPDDRERAREQFKSMIRRKPAGGVQTPGDPMSYRLRRRDGSYIWIHAEGIALVDEEGRTRRFITSYLDVTKFHEQEEALRRQVELTRTEEKRLDLVVRGARVGIVDWDGHTHATYYSPRFREIRGYPPDADTSNWPDYFRVMIHPDDRQRVTTRWVAFIRGFGPEGPHAEYYAPEEYRLLKADGSYAWVEVSGIAVRDEKGFVTRWIAAIIDITERHAQREALRAQNETLKENVRLREEVERIGRHDIKTPLNSIVAVPRLLREERKLGPEADELLGIVERAGYRILSMVNLSLDLYKMEQGSYVFRPDAVDLTDLIGKVIADVRTHAASKGVTVRQVVKHIPYVWAEELLCYSLLANLLKNAVEASPEGAEVWVRPSVADGRVRIAIHNRGAVPAAIRPIFFQKYSSLGKASGTGLGTYSARLMARVQDGDVTMQTSDEEGTTLTVILPAAPEGAMPATTRHFSERRGVDPRLIASMPPKQVLLVDDDEYNLLIVRRFLPSPPFTVATAINGRVALSAMQSNWPDLVFMDLDMPVMGGMEAVRAMRALERARGGATPCRIVALSSHDDEETRSQALASGFDRYLTKPVTREAIEEMLVRLLQAGGADAGVAPIRTRAAPAAAPARRDDTIVIDDDMEPVIGQFMASRRDLLANLRQAMAGGRREEVRRIAHQLAGSFALYGFEWAGAQARWIEQHAADVAGAQFDAVANGIEAHLRSVRLRTARGAIIETDGPGARGGTA